MPYIYSTTCLLKVYDANDFFKKLGQFEKEVKDSGIDMDMEHAYMNFLLKWVNYEVLPAIDNQYLFVAGKEIKPFSNAYDYFERTQKMVQDEFGSRGVMIEHDILSTGLRKMILGSKFAPYLSHVFGSEFMDGKHVNSGQTTIQYIAKALGPTEKTNVLFQINKGTYLDPSIDVDKRIAKKDRAVPFQNMTYALDGFTDVRACAILWDRGGYNIGVYDPDCEDAQERVRELANEQRVHVYAPADYSRGSALSELLEGRIMQVGEQILR